MGLCFRRQASDATTPTIGARSRIHRVTGHTLQPRVATVQRLGLVAVGEVPTPSSRAEVATSTDVATPCSTVFISSGGIVPLPRPPVRRWRLVKIAPGIASGPASTSVPSSPTRFATGCQTAPGRRRLRAHRRRRLPLRRRSPGRSRAARTRRFPRAPPHPPGQAAPSPSPSPSPARARRPRRRRPRAAAATTGG